MKSKISCWRLVRSIPEAPCSAGGDCSTNVCSYDTRGSDGKKRGLYWPRPRGDGGIGRRARLRALWGDCPVEVRVLFAALERSCCGGTFLFPGLIRQPFDDGQMTVAGVPDFSQDAETFQLPVTGGSEAYEGASG